MTVGYYVSRGKTVLVASVVIDTLSSYGFDKLLNDIREYVPVLLAVPNPVAPWLPSLGIHLQLKTGEIIFHWEIVGKSAWKSSVV